MINWSFLFAKVLHKNTKTYALWNLQKFSKNVHSWELFFLTISSGKYVLQISSSRTWKHIFSDLFGNFLENLRSSFFNHFIDNSILSSCGYSFINSFRNAFENFVGNFIGTLSVIPMNFIVFIFILPITALDFFFPKKGWWITFITLFNISNFISLRPVLFGFRPQFFRHILWVFFVRFSLLPLEIQKFAIGIVEGVFKEVSEFHLQKNCDFHENNWRNLKMESMNKLSKGFL